MDTRRIARYALTRVHPDGREEVVSAHATRLEGVEAGHAAMYAEREAAFSLYDGGRVVYRFGHSRIRRAADPVALFMLGAL